MLEDDQPAVEGNCIKAILRQKVPGRKKVSDESQDTNTRSGKSHKVSLGLPG